MKKEFKYTEEITGEIVQIPIGLLHPHPDNPRKDLGDLSELTESVKAKGILQNLTVVPRNEDYTVVIGHRRLEAGIRAGLETLPCIISDMTPSEQIQTMLLENIMRSDLTVFEQAQGFQMMMEFGDTVDSIAQKTGFSKSTVRRRLKIAEMDADTLRSVSTRQVDLTEYDRLSKIEDIETRNKVLCEIGTNNFERELQKAIDAQKLRKKKEEWQKILNAHDCVEIKYTDIWDIKYESLGFIEGNPDESKITELLKNHTTLFYAFGYSGTLYIRAIKSSSEEVDKEAQERRKKAEEERVQREKLSDLAKSAFKLRFDFIKNYSYKDSKKNIEKITDWMCIREILSMMCSGMFSGYSTALAGMERLRELYDVADGESWTKVSDFVDKHPEKALLMNVYAQWCDSENLDCYDYDLRFKDNPKLRCLYQCLSALGYEISTEEMKMLTGTHPLYRKSGDDAIDTENDDVEKTSEESDEDFDIELKEKLKELLGEMDE